MSHHNFGEQRRLRHLAAIEVRNLYLAPAPSSRPSSPPAQHAATTSRRLASPSEHVAPASASQPRHAPLANNTQSHDSVRPSRPPRRSSSSRTVTAAAAAASSSHGRSDGDGRDHDDVGEGHGEDRDEAAHATPSRRTPPRRRTASTASVASARSNRSTRSTATLRRASGSTTAPAPSAVPSTSSDDMDNGASGRRGERSTSRRRRASSPSSLHDDGAEQERELARRRWLAGWDAASLDVALRPRLRYAFVALYAHPDDATPFYTTPPSAEPGCNHAWGGHGGSAAGSGPGGVMAAAGAAFVRPREDFAPWAIERDGHAADGGATESHVSSTAGTTTRCANVLDANEVVVEVWGSSSADKTAESSAKGKDRLITDAADGRIGAEDERRSWRRVWRRKVDLTKLEKVSREDLESTPLPRNAVLLGLANLPPLESHPADQGDAVADPTIEKRIGEEQLPGKKDVASAAGAANVSTSGLKAARSGEQAEATTSSLQRIHSRRSATARAMEMSFHLVHPPPFHCYTEPTALSGPRDAQSTEEGRGVTEGRLRRPEMARRRSSSTAGGATESRRRSARRKAGGQRRLDGTASDAEEERRRAAGFERTTPVDGGSVWEEAQDDEAEDHASEPEPELAASDVADDHGKVTRPSEGGLLGREAESERPRVVRRRSSGTREAIERSLRETKMMPSYSVEDVKSLLASQRQVSEALAQLQEAELRANAAVSEPGGIPSLARSLGATREAGRGVEDKRDEERERVRRVRREVVAKRDALSRRRARLETARRSLAAERMASVQEKERLEKLNKKHEALLLRVHRRRTHLLRQLDFILPIELLDASQLLFTIAGVPLRNGVASSDSASSSDNSRAGGSSSRAVVDDDTVSSTALGLVGQAVCLLSTYLATPVHYPLAVAGSRGLILDAVSVMSGPRTFPLYSTGVEYYRYEYGVFLLNKNIEQLMNVHGIRPLDIRHTLPNLKNLIVTLSSTHLPPSRRSATPALKSAKERGVISLPTTTKATSAESNGGASRAGDGASASASTTDAHRADGAARTGATSSSAASWSLSSLLGWKAPASTSPVDQGGATARAGAVASTTDAGNEAEDKHGAKDSRDDGGGQLRGDATTNKDAGGRRRGHETGGDVSATNKSAAAPDVPTLRTLGGRGSAKPNTTRLGWLRG